MNQQLIHIRCEALMNFTLPRGAADDKDQVMLGPGLPWEGRVSC